MGGADARLRPKLDPTAIRDAATLVLLREDAGGGPSVLMGQRGAKAAFMPSKYVFPGGAVDKADVDVPLARDLAAPVRSALAHRSSQSPKALAVAAIRELVEETGQILAQPASTSPPWRGFAGQGPDASALRFVFRAITPPGRPRRFDARFFLAPASALRSDPDDFSAAEDELGHLHWVPLAEARRLDLPFITEVVLAEVAAITEGRETQGVPFFDNSGDASLFLRL